jgi:hypothetical protein
VTAVLGDIFLFIVPGDLLHPFSSLYEADRYSASTLFTNTPGKNSIYEADRYSASTLFTNTPGKNSIAFLMAVDDGGDYSNGIPIAAPMRSAARGLRVNLNQSAYDFRADRLFSMR